MKKLFYQRIIVVLLMLFLNIMPMTACAASASDIMNRYEAVLSGAQNYLQCDIYNGTVREATISDTISEWYGYPFSIPLTYEAFSVIDLDRDGNPEILLQLSEYFGFELLRYENGQVYGFPFVYRAMERITIAGEIHGSNGADDYGWYRVHFAGETMETEDVCWKHVDADYHFQYTIGGKEVTENEFEQLCNDLEGKEQPIWYVYTMDNFHAAVAAIGEE